MAKEKAETKETKEVEPLHLNHVSKANKKGNVSLFTNRGEYKMPLEFAKLIVNSKLFPPAPLKEIE